MDPKDGIVDDSQEGVSRAWRSGMISSEALDYF
jgi:hypothetical protein